MSLIDNINLYKNRYENSKVISGIYIILNKITKLYYLGSSKKLVFRKYQHFENLKKNKHVNRYLQNAWNKYGEQNFEFIIIEPTIELLEREQYYLDMFTPYKKGVGYNIEKTVSGNTIKIRKNKRKNQSDVNKRKNVEKQKQRIKSMWKHRKFWAKGEDKTNAKLSTRDVVNIKNMHELGFHYSVISKLFKCSERNIRTIMEGTGWAHVSPSIQLKEEKIIRKKKQKTFQELINDLNKSENPLSKNRYKKLPNKKVENIKNMAVLGFAASVISKVMNVPECTILQIMKGSIRTDIKPNLGKYEAQI